MKQMTSVIMATMVAVLATGCVADGAERPYGYDSGYRYEQPSYNNNYRSPYMERYGVVIGVRWVKSSSHQGAVIGAVVGGLLGNQVGKGDGRTAATVGGAVAGGFIGNEIDKKHDGMRQIVDVRLDNGQVVSVVQNSDQGFYVGQHVMVAGDDRHARVMDDRYRR